MKLVDQKNRSAKIAKIFKTRPPKKYSAHAPSIFYFFQDVAVIIISANTASSKRTVEIVSFS